MRCRSGRRARWARSTPGPTGGGGFEYFYGFIGGETNQYYPAIYEGTTPVEPERTQEGAPPEPTMMGAAMAGPLLGSVRRPPTPRYGT